MPRSTGKTPASGGRKQAGRPSKPSSNARNEPRRTAEEESGARIALPLQQTALNVFRDAFGPSGDDKPVLQEVKAHLFKRDFATAFGQTRYLTVYASRWSPSRALGYGQILTDLDEYIIGPDTIAERDDDDDDDEDDNDSHATGPSTLRVVCIGGGAGAELVGLATWLTSEHHRAASGRGPMAVHCTLLDMADWAPVVARLYSGVTVPPPLSPYASAAARAAHRALVVAPERYTVRFEQRDVLGLGDAAARAQFGDAALVTLMFTLNELYSTSKLRTQQLLGRLTAAVRPGTLLLVVDSPGSYSTVSLNGTEATYPMEWLLEYALLGRPEGSGKSDPAPTRWRKLVTDDSRWFRLPPGLQYPIELENMRYQIHLYRRLGPEGNDGI